MGKEKECTGPGKITKPLPAWDTETNPKETEAR